MKREITSDIRWQIFLRNCGYLLCVILLGWGVYVASLFGITIRSRGQIIVDALAGQQRDRKPGGELIIASGLTSSAAPS